MRLTPVILSYNHEVLTERCVRSTLTYFDGDRPLYLVHNGSEKGVRERLQNLFPRVRHVTLPVNMQFSGGANEGIERAFSDGAEAVFFISNDVVIANLNERVLDNHCHGNEAFLLAPQIQRRETGELDSCGAHVDLLRGRLTHLRSLDIASPSRFYVPGACFVVSREAWRRLSGFDPSLGSYWEDVDLSLRARRRGVRLGRIPEIIVKHGIGKTCHSNPLYTVYYFHRNRRRVTWRHGSYKERLSFCGIYAVETLGKSFKLLKNKDFSRLKLLLRAAVS